MTNLNVFPLESRHLLNPPGIIPNDVSMGHVVDNGHLPQEVLALDIPQAYLLDGVLFILSLASSFEYRSEPSLSNLFDVVK